MNVDKEVVSDFGREWAAFDQTALPDDERTSLFEAYFAIFPFHQLSPSAEGFDLGCGSGRWAALMAPRVGILHCIDPAPDALEVAKRAVPTGQFHLADVGNIPLADNSQDFGYSIGVLHHVPDTQAALDACVRKLKLGAPFLVYLYYAFDNRPAWYRMIWKASDLVRRVVSRLPFPLKRAVAEIVAALIYWPFSRLGYVFGDNFPLADYRRCSFYTMRTDALDRFGTRLEKRFTKEQIRQMMARAGLGDIRFSDEIPYWIAVGIRSPRP